MSDDLRLLVLSLLRTAIETRTTAPVERAYVLCGGVGAGVPIKPAQRQLPPVSGPVMAPAGWETLANVR